MPLGGIFGRSRGERSRAHSRNLSSPNASVFMSDGPEPPSTPRVTRTRAKTLLSGPRTPLSKIFTSFGGKGAESWGKNLVESQDVEPAIIRPGSASSAYSSSSDSSFESMLTTATDYTVPDAGDDSDNDSVASPKLGPAFSDNLLEEPSLTSTGPASQRKRKLQERESFGVRDIEWTDEMDAHLWKTYMLYQSDPTVTPFYVVPGAFLRLVYVFVWPELLGIAGKGEGKAVATNKADLMRKSSLLRWPASESATRKRLRLLCRHPVPFRSRIRPSHDQHSSGLIGPIADDEAETSDRPLGNALLTSTRSMALSLATTMTGGMNLPVEPEAMPATRNHDSLPEFRGFTDANGNAPPVAVILASVGLGHPIPSRNAPPNPHPTSSQLPRTPLFQRRARANTTTSATINPPVALAPLAPLNLGPLPSLSRFETWPSHRSNEASSEAAEEFGGPLPRPNANVREPAESIFEPIPEPKTPPPRNRPRGYTVGVGPSNGMNGRRRPRPSPIGTSLPSWAYDMPEGASDRPNLAQLLGAQPLSAGLPRLGSPFVEDYSDKGKWRSAADPEEFGPPLPKKTGAFLGAVVIGQDTRKEIHASEDDEDSGRPIKRMRE
ncbi:hypothetical protein BDZ91DRAFT_767462 [Kalaharituber pfeilii]|nr:hypothetical protein BDZ91DRAFT_767462 [Kalaharituber pfeilii]